MATTYRVTPAQLTQQAQDLQALNERFKTEVTAMTEKEEALSSMWEGEARNAFHNAFATDVQKFQEFYNTVARFVQTLGENAQKYQKAEAQSAAIATTRS